MEENKDFDLIGSKIEEGIFRYKLSFPFDKILDNFSFISGSFYPCDVEGERKYVQVFTVEGMAYGNENKNDGNDDVNGEEESRFFIFFIGSQPLSKDEMDKIIEDMKKEAEEQNDDDSKAEYDKDSVEFIG